ncbi:MAG: hypothetical protein ABFR50_01080 [Candidatus Fermentibacteria bacterium]
MTNKNRDDLLHRINPPEPRLLYRYNPVRSVIVTCIFLALCAAAALFLLPRAPQVNYVLAIFAFVLLFKLLKDCSVKVWLDWPNLIYRYRSLFRRIDMVIPSWEISGISPEITSMWRGSISECLVLEAGEKKFVITPYYSQQNKETAMLMDEIHRLPQTRKQAEYEIELERRVRDGDDGKLEETARETVWCMLEMSIDCPRCDRPVVVNGPFTSFICPECSETIEMTPEIWADLLEDVRDEIADDTEEGKGSRSVIWGTYNTNLYYGRLKPCCPECKRDFDMENEYEGGDALTCIGCSTKVSVEPAPSWFDSVFEGALLIVGAQYKQTVKSTADNEISPISFTCSQCGGAILSCGEERTVKCEHCGASIYLPDELWFRFHPAPKKQRWFVGFEAEVYEWDDDDPEEE